MRESLFVSFVGQPRKRVHCSRCRNWIFLSPQQTNRSTTSINIMCAKCEDHLDRS